MEINLQSIETSCILESEKHVFSLLSSSLTLSQEEKMEELANRIDQLCPSNDSRKDIETTLWNLWLMVIDVLRLIPPGHPWQEVLVGAIKKLREGEPTTKPRAKPLSVPIILIDPKEVSDETPTPSVTAGWENLNSFAARLTASGYTDWLFTFPIWSLRTALEEPFPPEEEQLATNTRLRVASNWIIQCSAVLFTEMTASDEEASDKDCA